MKTNGHARGARRVEGTGITDLRPLADSLDTYARQIHLIAEIIRSIEEESAEQSTEAKAAENTAPCSLHDGQQHLTSTPVISDTLDRTPVIEAHAAPVVDSISPEAIWQRVSGARKATEARAIEWMPVRRANASSAENDTPVRTNGPTSAESRHKMSAPTEPDDPDVRVHAAWLAQVSDATDRLLAKQVPKQDGGSTSVSAISSNPAVRLVGHAVPPPQLPRLGRRSGLIVMVLVGFIFALALAAVSAIPQHLWLSESWRQPTGDRTMEMTASEPLASAPISPAPARPEPDRESIPQLQPERQDVQPQRTIDPPHVAFLPLPQGVPQSTGAKGITVESGAEPEITNSTCYASASAVRQDHPEEWPSWTLRALGHEGTKCWYPTTRTLAHAHPK